MSGTSAPQDSDEQLTEQSIDDTLAQFERKLDECQEDLEAIADWDGKLGAMARVLISLAENEKPDTADLIDAGLNKYAMEREGEN